MQLVRVVIFGSDLRDFPNLLSERNPHFSFFFRGKKKRVEQKKKVDPLIVRLNEFEYESERSEHVLTDYGTISATALCFFSSPSLSLFFLFLSGPHVGD